MGRPPLPGPPPHDGFILFLFYFFFFKDVFFTVKVVDGCLRLGGRHLEEDASDVRDDDRGGGGGDDRPAL